MHNWHKWIYPSIGGLIIIGATGIMVGCSSTKFEPVTVDYQKAQTDLDKVLSNIEGTFKKNQVAVKSDWFFDSNSNPDQLFIDGPAGITKSALASTDVLSASIFGSDNWINHDGNFMQAFLNSQIGTDFHPEWAKAGTYGTSQLLLDQVTLPLTNVLVQFKKDSHGPRWFNPAALNQPSTYGHLSNPSTPNTIQFNLNYGTKDTKEAMAEARKPYVQFEQNLNDWLETNVFTSLTIDSSHMNQSLGQIICNTFSFPAPSGLAFDGMPITDIKPVSGLHSYNLADAVLGGLSTAGSNTQTIDVNIPDDFLQLTLASGAGSKTITKIVPVHFGDTFTVNITKDSEGRSDNVKKLMALNDKLHGFSSSLSINNDLTLGQTISGTNGLIDQVKSKINRSSPTSDDIKMSILNLYQSSSSSVPATAISDLLSSGKEVSTIQPDDGVLYSLYEHPSTATLHDDTKYMGQVRLFSNELNLRYDLPVTFSLNQSN